MADVDAYCPGTTSIDLDAVLETMHAAFFALDPTGRIVHVNGRAEELWRRRRDGLLGRTLVSAFPQLAGTDVLAALEQALADGRRRHLETISPVRGVPVDMDIVPARPGLLVFVRDLTRLRQVESELRARDDSLTLAEESAGIGVWDIDLASDTVRGTPQFFRNMGLEPSAEPVPMGRLRGLRPPEERQRVNQAFEEVVRRGSEFFEVEYPIQWPDGTTRWIFGRGRVIRDGGGRPIRYTGVDVDVTERKSAEAALRESEQRFRRVFEQSPLGKVTANPDRTLREVNPAFCRMLGYTAEELVGRDFIEIVHPDDRERCAEMAHALVRGEIPQIQFEERFIRKSGDTFWVSINVGPIRDGNDRLIYALGVIEEIDDRKRMIGVLAENEQKLRVLNERLESLAEDRARQLAASRAQLQAFFDNSPDWLTLQRATPDGRFIYVDLNPSCEAGYGLSRDAVIGRTPEEVLGTAVAELPLRHLRACVQTGEPQHYVAHRTMAGRSRTIDVMFVLVPGQSEHGERYVLTAARDITEWEELQAQLRQAQKMEAIGHLTGGVAHDFNNLLAVIIGNAELARRRADTEMGRLLDNIITAGERGVGLTRQLLSFARRNAGTPRVLDLSAEMPRIAEMLRASLRGNIEMQLLMSAQCWPIEVDPDEFGIALLNIAVNARDAMPHGGRFEIEVHNATGGPGESDYVAITLRDSGVGIPASVLSKVFDPFFTTKGAGVGTGLGLSQVYGFARDAGGSVDISSTPGAGTSVTLRLPRSQKLVAQPDACAADEAPAGVDGHILLVEDNPDVAHVTAEMLRDMGFEVETVDRARKGLDRLVLDDFSIDLLLSDVVMPDGMNGLDLARAVRARWPDLPIVLMSGYNEAVPAGGAGFRVLRKPVPSGELREAIVNAMRSPLPA